MTMAERWLYFPLIGLIPFLVLMVFKLKIQKRKIFIFFITISLVFGLRTFARNKNWKDGLTLYGHDIEYSQNSFDLENNYGVELFREGKISEAQKHFEKSISLQPNWKISRNNLGAIYQNQGKLEKAKEQYYKSIEIGDYKLAYENLASILLSQEKNKEALDLLEKGVLIFNQSDKIKKLLVIAYYRVGKIENSMNLLSQIIKESPDDQEANYLFWVIKNKKDIKF